MRVEILSMQDISKKFHPSLFLDSFSFSLYEGELLGITGLSASGKSVVAGILAGIYTEDSGKIFLYGESVKIGMIEKAYQHRIYCIGAGMRISAGLSIAEWMCLSGSQRKKWMKRKTMIQITGDIFKEYGINMDVTKKGGMLSYYEQKISELLAAAWQGAGVIVLDEVFCGLSRIEYYSMYKTLGKLIEKGIGILVIESDMKNLFPIADRIIVMRAGTLGGVFYRGVTGYDEESLYKVSVQNVMERREPLKSDREYPLLLRADGIQIPGKVHKGSFHIGRGEAVGFVDKGKRACQLLEDILMSGEYFRADIYLEGTRLNCTSKSQALKKGIVSLNGSDGGNQIFPGMTIGENIMLLNLKICCKGGEIISKKKYRFIMKEYARLMGIDESVLEQMPYEADYNIKALVPFMRLLACRPKIILVDSSFVRADIYIQEKMADLIDYARAHGMSIVYCAMAEEEARKFCGRVYHLTDGRIIESAPPVIKNTSLFKSGRDL